MVALRSGGRQDVALLVAVWVLTVAALVLGIVLVAPILIFWGAVGLVGAFFLTRIHRRTTSAAAEEPRESAPDSAQDEEKSK